MKIAKIGKDETAPTGKNDFNRYSPEKNGSNADSGYHQVQ
jgi:hypothetical protein